MIGATGPTGATLEENSFEEPIIDLERRIEAGPGVQAVFSEVPALRSIRAPVRFLFPACFAATVFACVAWSRVLASGPRARLQGLVALGSLELAAVAALTAPTVSAEVYRVRPVTLDKYHVGDVDETGSPVRSSSWGFWVKRRELEGLSAADQAARFATLPLTHDLAMRYDLRAAYGYGEPQFAWQDRTFRKLESTQEENNNNETNNHKFTEILTNTQKFNHTHAHTHCQSRMSD